MSASFAPDPVRTAPCYERRAPESDIEARERSRRRRLAAARREHRPSFDHLAIGAPLTAAFIGMLLVDAAAVESRGAADGSGISPARGAGGAHPGADAAGTEGGGIGAGAAGTVAAGGAAAGARAELGSEGESAAGGPLQASDPSGAGVAVAGAPASFGTASGGGVAAGGKGKFSLSAPDGMPSDPAAEPENPNEPGTIGKHVTGTSGDDIIRGTSGDDSLSGGPGNDIIYGLEGDDLLDGGLGNDKLFGGPGNDVLYGGPGHDMLDGGPGDDELFGGPGNDDLFGKAGRDILHGGTGNDLLNGGADADRMSGDAGDDILIVDNLHDLALENGRARDGGGTDTLQVNQGFADSLKSAFGEDAATFVMHDRLSAPLADGVNGYRQQVDPDIEHIVLKGTANHDVIGNDRANAITGNAGDNVLLGGGGADVLRGGGGADELRGGAGRDRLFGDDGNDILLGGADDDLLRGGAGDDLLDGGTGADRLFGEAGNDTFQIGLHDSALDFIHDSEGSNQVVVKGAAGHLIETAVAGNDLYIVADKNPIGVISDYRGQSDAFSGIDAGNGTASIGDLMAENADRGPALGGQGSKTASNAGEDLLEPYLSQPSIVGSSGDDFLQGTSGADWLQGRGGNDHLLGGAGRDVLQGGAGDDLLQGGADADRYLFRAGESGFDVIRDVEGANVAELQGFGGAKVQAVIDGRDLLVVANHAPVFKVENYVGNEEHFTGVQRGDDFIPTDDLFS